MNDIPTPVFQSESVFRDHLVMLLRDAGISAKCESSVFRNWDQPYLLRADIIIGEDFIGCDAIIECKTACDAQSLSTAFGQAIIYRRAFAAKAAVLCFPSSVQLPGMFKEICITYNISIATELNLVAVVQALPH